MYQPTSQAHPSLLSWNEGPTKNAIIDFVQSVTDAESTDFIHPSDRIAVFDNDGTLWSEKPAYFQFLFALDRVNAMAKTDAALINTPVLEAAIGGDIDALLDLGVPAILEIVAATHSGMSIETFQDQAAEWLKRARHPVSGMPFTSMVYQPMLELLDYLRAYEFNVYIVSGGGLDFIRVFAEDVYGVPPQNVVGSFGEARLEVERGKPRIMKDPGVGFLDDKEGKPLGIARHIGKRPVFVAGNSDGDLAMAQWSTAGEGARFAMFVHHTDAEREFAYDRESPVGRFDEALDAAPENGWTIVDIAADWRAVYGGEK